MTHIIEKNKCTGCNACFNICPTNAISMLEDKEGFKFPIIDETKCTNCGLCSKICPVINTKYDNEENPKCFAFMANDEIRKNSASGGVFAHLAHIFINNGGYAVGAVYTNDWSVEHIVSNKLEDIAKMQSSKYLQSDTKSCYKEIKNILDQGKKVLFSGTPCQVAGLKSYLRKDYENLYSLDILCHGVPSKKVFKKYLDEVYGIENVKSYNFRSKEKNGWSGCSKCELSTGEVILKEKKNDEFYIPFLGNLILRECCGNCQFNKLPRQGDITIGDFWGIHRYNKKLNDKKGTSVVLANNKKADYLVNLLQKNSKLLKEVPLKYSLPDNPNITTHSVMHKKRDVFYNNIDNLSYKENIEQIFGDKCDYLIVNFWDSSYNYGAMLTAYALQEIIKEFGYIPKILNAGEKTHYSWYKNSHLEEFANQHLDITKELSFKECKELAKSLRGVIVGSDQVLRLDLIRGFFNKYLLNFATKNNQKIAMSASFGMDKNTYLAKQKPTQEELKMMKNSLMSFDYLSSREFEGVEIFKDFFGLDADMILDPVFLLDKNKYLELANESKLDISDNLFSYILKTKDEYKEVKEFLCKKTNLPLLELDRFSTQNAQDWLKGIINSKLIITDSFHCVCFAMIFNKPFICVDNNVGASARFNSLFKLVGVPNSLISKLSDVYNMELPFDMSFEKINELLSTEKERCLTIFENVLKNGYSNNKNKTSVEPFKYGKLKWYNKYMKYLKCKYFSQLLKGKKKVSYKEKSTFRKKELEWNK